jgi:hypothetical protein
LGCRKLAAGLASEIGHHRRVVISTTGLGSFRSGYPELDLDRRFFLPWLRNLQRQPYLSSADLEALGEMTRKLTDPEALSRYGRRVKRIVNSRREKALSKVSNQANPDLEEE